MGSWGVDARALACMCERTHSRTPRRTYKSADDTGICPSHAVRPLSLSMSARNPRSSHGDPLARRWPGDAGRGRAGVAAVTGLHERDHPFQISEHELQRLRPTLLRFRASGGGHAAEGALRKDRRAKSPQRGSFEIVAGNGPSRLGFGRTTSLLRRCRQRCLSMSVSASGGLAAGRRLRNRPGDGSAHVHRGHRPRGPRQQGVAPNGNAAINVDRRCRDARPRRPPTTHAGPPTSLRVHGQRPGGHEARRHTERRPHLGARRPHIPPPGAQPCGHASVPVQ